MSNVLEVAEVSERPSIVVVSRTLLWQGGVVEIKVSANATEFWFITQEGEAIQGLQFSRGVRSGHINCFLHTDEMSLRGKKIVASVAVWKKKLNDGREFLYLDFHQTRAEVTHTLVVMPGKPDAATIPDRGLVFETLDTSTSIRFGSWVRSVGTVILSPVEEKAVPEVDSEPFVKQTPPNAVRKSTGDPKLDEYIDSGWEITKDNGVTATLTKIKKGKPAEMVYYRPNPKKNNGKRK